MLPTVAVFIVFDGTFWTWGTAAMPCPSLNASYYFYGTGAVGAGAPNVPGSVVSPATAGGLLAGNLAFSAAAVSMYCVAGAPLYHGWYGYCWGSYSIGYNALEATGNGGVYPYLLGDSPSCKVRRRRTPYTLHPKP